MGTDHPFHDERRPGLLPAGELTALGAPPPSVVIGRSACTAPHHRLTTLEVSANAGMSKRSALVTIALRRRIGKRFDVGELRTCWGEVPGGLGQLVDPLPMDYSTSPSVDPIEYPLSAAAAVRMLRSIADGEWEVYYRRIIDLTDSSKLAVDEADESHAAAPEPAAVAGGD